MANEKIEYPELPDHLRRGLNLKLLGYFGAGAIIASVTIGSGETFFASRGGAIFGFAVLWFLAISAIAKGVMVYTGTRHFILTGTHPMTHWGKMPGPKNWVPWMFAGISLLCFPFWIAGLPMFLGSAINWMFGLEDTVPVRVWGVLLIIIAAALTWVQSYGVLEKIQTVLVSTLLLSMLAAAFVCNPDWIEVIKGLLLPSFPSYPDWFLVQEIGKDVEAGIRNSAGAWGTNLVVSVTDAGLTTTNRLVELTVISADDALQQASEALAASGGNSLADSLFATANSTDPLNVIAASVADATQSALQGSGTNVSAAVAQEVKESISSWTIQPAWAEIGLYLGAIGGGTYDYLGYLGCHREKSWGLIGKGDGLDTSRIADDPENIRRAKRWLIPGRIDVGVGFFCVLIFTICFTVLGATVLGSQEKVPDEETEALSLQAEFLTQIHPSLEYLYKVGIFMAFWGTIYGAFEIYIRTARECLLPLSAKVRATKPKTFSRWIILYCALGGILLMFLFDKPTDMVKPAAIIGGVFLCGPWCFAMIWADRKFVPKALKMNPVLLLVNLLSGILLTGLGVKAIIDNFF